MEFPTFNIKQKNGSDYGFATASAYGDIHLVGYARFATVQR